MNYQDRLTSQRRLALWRQLRARAAAEQPDSSQETPWDSNSYQGKRPDQVGYSLIVLAFLCGIGAVGVAFGALWAFWNR